LATSFGNLVGKVAKVVEGGQSMGLARVGVQHVMLEASAAVMAMQTPIIW
jgi:hypothetical protein